MRLFYFGFIFVMSCVWVTAVSAEMRVALVIGNSSYKYTPALGNPKNDAEDVSAALGRLHFTVTKHQDLDVRGFDLAVNAFETAAQGADVALFFFAGHGVQIDRKGYLAPIDVNAESESSALRELVAISRNRLPHPARRQG